MDIFSQDLWTEGQLPDKSPVLSSLLSLLDRIPALVWATGPDCRFRSLTGAGLSAAGIHADRHLGQPVDSLFGCPAAMDAHRKALHGSPGSFHAEVKGHSLEAQVEPLQGPDGVVEGVVGVALDGTPRLMAETALRLSEQSYRSLIEEAPYAMCRATESGQLLQVNHAMLEMLGYDPASEADLLVRDLPYIYASPERFQALLAGLQTGLLQGQESTWIRQDGKSIQVRISVRAARDSAGRILHLDLIAENVTERKELEARLAQAQKMQAIGQLAGGIAHDFNNILTVINGYCDLLLASQRHESRERESLELIRQAGERATNLTQQLLAFSRKQVTHQRPVQLNQVVSEVLKLSRRLIGENIALIEILGETAGHVLADEAQIHQMLMNLVINARDAMASGGRFTVTTSATRVEGDLAKRLDVTPGDYVLLTVTDTGVGMDEHVLSRVFEPFFTTKPAGKGTGLGLSSVYGIVRQSRGAVTVDSFPGCGTSFRIYLPQLNGAQPSLAAEMPGPEPVRSASTILLVEDESSVRNFAAAVLARSGHTVLEASDGEEALVLAEHYHEPIHLLFTDIVMPGLSGRDLAKRFAALHGESKILLTSGYSETLAGNRSLDASINFLAKPFSAEQLTRIVDRILSEK
jgi:two-component system cell cycle sensor histidine kinase/response regulator CckA